jgi:O-antigen ligase
VVADQAARTVVVAGVGAMLILGGAMIATGGGPVGVLQPLYGDARFRGWAENPNQLALLLLAAPVAALGFARTDGARSRPLWLAVAVAALALGVITGSDALRAAWAAIGGLAVVLAWRRLVFGRFARRAPAALAAIAVPVAVAGAVLLAGDRVVETVSEQVAETFAVGGQGEDRVGRWLFGLEALALSPLVGLGPGAFSGATGPFQAQEAHNSAVDWVTGSGLLGFAALLVMGMLGAVALGVRRQPVSAAVGIAIVVFAMLHYVFRQPLAWFLVFAVFEGLFDDGPVREARLGA